MIHQQTYLSSTPAPLTPLYSYLSLPKQNNSLHMAVPALITSLSTRWFSSTEARLLHSAGCFARGNWLVYTHLLLMSCVEPDCRAGRAVLPLDSVQAVWASRFRCEETAAATHTEPSAETGRNALFLLLATVKLHCVELVTVYGISRF